jgi:diketogulonate reductase-like aldo/keto reductase
METISEETGLSMSQLSLAWLLANAAITSPIIGASKLEQVEENVEVVNQAVPAEAVTRISEVSKPDWLCEQEETEAHLRALEEQRRSYWKKRSEVKS